MGKFTKISTTAPNELQLDAGVVVKNFNPDSPATITDSDIICATSGGINISCTPTYSDFGEDIDNCPANTKEFAQITSWACTISFTSLSVTEETVKLALGAATVDATTGKIMPKAHVDVADFREIWWVGDRSDGGMVAVHMKNAISTGGFSIQTTKANKGQVSVTITGFASLANPDEVPMEFYVKAGESA